MAQIANLIFNFLKMPVVSQMQAFVQKAVLQQGNQILLTNEFRQALSNSLFPLVIPFLGCSRAGKSTRLNQLLSRQLRSQQPFRSQGGSAAVTTGFDFSGPHDLQTLCRYHSVPYRLPSKRRADVFLIDCEGMDHLNGSSTGYGQVILALSQITTITVLIHGRLLSSNDIQHISRLFQMTKFLSSASQQLETGFVTIERAIGVPVDPDVSDTSPEYEETRRVQNSWRNDIN
jgi:hypothetical protein